MKKDSNLTTKRDQFFSFIVDSIEEELIQVLSSNIDNGRFEDFVTAEVAIGDVIYEIEYHPYDKDLTTLAVVKPNNSDCKNIENHILSMLDFYQIESDARDIYDSLEDYNEDEY